MKGSPEHFSILAIAILGLSLWLMWFFTKTPFGQIQVGIRDNAKRIDYLGYKVPQSKAIIYVISGAFAGCRFNLWIVSQLVIAMARWGFGILYPYHCSNDRWDW